MSYAIYRLFEDKTLLNDRLVNKKDSKAVVQPEKNHASISEDIIAAE